MIHLTSHTPIDYSELIIKVALTRYPQPYQPQTKNPTSSICNSTKQKLSHRNLFLKSLKPQKNLQALHLKTLDNLYIFIYPTLKNKQDNT